MKNISNAMWGVLFIVVGLIIGLNTMEIININIFFDGWWTLFIIIPCFINLFKDEDRTWNLIGIIIGILLLLCCQNVFRFELLWKLLVPIVLVIVGLSFIFKDVISGKIKKEMKNINKDKKDISEYCATFGVQELVFDKEEFKGCELNAIFGSVKCDLRGSIIKEDVIVTANAIFGGIDVYVPDNVNVKITSTPIFGGVTNHRRRKKKEGEYTIYIQAICLFGGVEIKWHKYKELLNI